MAVENLNRSLCIQHLTELAEIKLFEFQRNGSKSSVVEVASF